MRENYEWSFWFQGWEMGLVGQVLALPCYQMDLRLDLHCPCLASLISGQRAGDRQIPGASSQPSRMVSPPGVQERETENQKGSLTSGLAVQAHHSPAFALGNLDSGCFYKWNTSLLHKVQCLDPGSPPLWQASLQMKGFLGPKSQLEGRIWVLVPLTL